MRPRLHPSLTRIWRDHCTLQLGITPDHAVLLGGLSPADIAVLRAMDGGRTTEQLREVAADEGADAASADHLVKTLLASNAVVDDHAFADRLREPDPDTASAALLSDEPDAGHSVMTARHRAHVQVHGAGRIGSVVARLLAACGIGSVAVEDDALVSSSDLSPGGLDAGDIGIRRDRATRAHLPEPMAAADSPPDLVVLAPALGPLADTGDRFVRNGTPHLVAQVIETTGYVGPLVVPGESPCLRCVELHRTGNDSMWPLVVGHGAHRPPPAPACDAALSATVAALAASHVVAFLDGSAVASIGGVVEISLPSGRPRRRSWSTHPACGCAWDDEP